MHWMKRSLGIVLALFGVVGVMACIVGIIEVWSTRGRVDESAVRVLDRVDDVLAKVHTRAEIAADRITT